MAHGGQFADMPFRSNFRPGETRSCIVLNGVGEEYLENITLSDIQIRFDGGGSAEEARREVPKMAGEYFEIDTPLAYALFARNTKGLTLRNVRLEAAAATAETMSTTGRTAGFRSATSAF